MTSCLVSLLERMAIRLTVGLEGARTLIACTVMGVVDSHYCHTDRGPSTTSKMDYLLLEVADHAVDLLDHGLSEDLHFNANFYCGNFSAGYVKACIGHSRFTGYDLTESSVTTPCLNALPPIGGVQYPFF